MIGNNKKEKIQKKQRPSEFGGQDNNKFNKPNRNNKKRQDNSSSEK